MALRVAGPDPLVAHLRKAGAVRLQRVDPLLFRGGLCLRLSLRVDVALLRTGRGLPAVAGHAVLLRRCVHGQPWVRATSPTFTEIETPVKSETTLPFHVPLR